MFATVERRAEYFRASIRANLRYWRVVRVPDPSITTFPDRDWPNLIRAITFALDVPDTAGDAGRLMWDLFDVMEHRTAWREWIPLLERAVATQTDTALRHNLTNHLGQCLRLDGRYQRAIETHRAVLDDPSARDDPLALAHALAGSAETCRYMRAFADAESYGQRALKTLGSLPNERRIFLAVLNTLGLTNLSLGRPAEAIVRLRDAIKLAETLDLRLYVGRIRHNLGNALTAAGRVDEAFAAYADGIAELIALKASAYDIAGVELSRGTLHFMLGQLDQAAAAFGRIDVEALRRAGHITSAAMSANNLGNIYQAQGRFEESEHKMHEAVALFRGLEDPVELANALGVLGEVVAAQGRRAEAEPYWREAIALLEPFAADARVQRLLDGARRNLTGGSS